MPRFVVLAHDWPSPHWDFLAESGGVLRAWRLLAEPVAGAEVPAEPNVDHRLAYLDYEGQVSGGRGRVARWAVGTCEWLADEVERVELELCGGKLAGRAVIRAVGGGWTFRLTVRAAPG